MNNIDSIYGFTTSPEYRMDVVFVEMTLTEKRQARKRERIESLKEIGFALGIAFGHALQVSSVLALMYYLFK